jgi:AcrR family transcriptional regulator
MTEPTTGSGPLFGRDWSDHRADARRNRSRIETAAVEVFAERGLDATIPEIAARAGVGKATVYRSFPTKEDLVRLVALHFMERIEARTQVAISEMDSPDALDRMLLDIFERFRLNHMKVAVIASHTNVNGTAIPGTEATVERLRELFRKLLDDGVRRGDVSPDVSVLEVEVLITGAATRLIDADIRDPAVWSRIAQMVTRSMRP